MVRIFVGHYKYPHYDDIVPDSEPHTLYTIVPTIITVRVFLSLSPYP